MNERRETNVTVNISIRITEDTDLEKLRERIAGQVRKLSNPVRTDEGITSVQSVTLSDLANYYELNYRPFISFVSALPDS
jgi:small-conductance mechanosensitive channel